MVKLTEQLLRVTLGTMLFVVSGSLSASLLRAPRSLNPAPATVQTTTPTPRTAIAFPMRITNRVFNDSLLYPSSEYYKRLHSEVVQLLTSIYDCSDCYTKQTYAGVAAMTFRNGSVIVNSTIVFNTLFINPDVCKYIFIRAINDVSKNLTIDVDYTRDIGTPIYVPVPTSGPTTSFTRTTPFSRPTSPLTVTGTSATTATPTSPLSRVPTTQVGASTTDIGTPIYVPVPTSGPTTSFTRTTPFSRPTSPLTVTGTSATTATPTSPLSSVPTTQVGASTTGNDSSAGSTSLPPSYTSHGQNGTTSPSGGIITTITSDPPVDTSKPLSTVTNTQSAGKHTVAPEKPPAATSAKPSPVTLPILHPNETSPSSPAPMAAGGGWVPGWAIALLVLASVILLLIILLLIITLVHWCCTTTETGVMNVYETTTPKENRAYIPQTPTKQPELESFKEEPEKPKKKIGMYVVNP